MSCEHTDLARGRCCSTGHGPEERDIIVGCRDTLGVCRPLALQSRGLVEVCGGGPSSSSGVWEAS